MLKLDWIDISEELNYFLNNPELEDKIMEALPKKTKNNE
jgi:hypothetical protein